MPDTVAVFNGEVVRTSYLTRTELAVMLGPTQTAQPGSYLISVQTPAPGGGIADPMEFIVQYQAD